jgi:hypothetical protein
MRWALTRSWSGRGYDSAGLITKDEHAGAFAACLQIYFLYVTISGRILGLLEL